jgi:uncharacterized protein (DUF1330 family)
MPAYVIVDVQINNPKVYEEYKKLTPATIAAYGGSFLARGGNTEVLEGTWRPGRVVILQFPDVQRARLWWNSGEYAPAKKLRQMAATTQMILVEGNVPPI